MGGGGSKPQITCNDVIRNFRKEKFFVGQRYRRIENQKSRPGLAVAQKFAKRKGLKSKVKKQYKASGEKSITIQNSTETGLDSKLTVLFEFKHKGVIYVQFSFDFGDPKIFTNVQVARVHFFYKLYSIIAMCKSGFVVVRIILRCSL